MTKRTSRSTRTRTSAASSASMSRVRSSGPVAPTTPEQLQNQYQYVLEDLKRIGLIAMMLIGGLVVLSFFIRG
jgi:hypothetical protein